MATAHLRDFILWDGGSAAFIKYRFPNTGLPVSNLPDRRFHRTGIISKPENLLDFIRILQEELVYAGIPPSGYDFEKLHEFVDMQPGDIPVTCADSKPLEEDFGYRPATGIREGLHKFAKWYKEYYHCPSCRNR